VTASSRIRAIRGVFSLEPFDTSTDEGRSQERYRRVALSSVAAAGARAVTVGAGLITVPLAFRYLGVERYGVFVTITALAAFVSWSDLGIGNGILTLVSRAYARGDRDEAVRVVSAATLVLLATAGALAIVFAAVFAFVPWADLLNVKSHEARAEVGTAVAVFVAFTLAAVPLGVAQRAQLAFQEGFRASLWAASGSVASVVGLVLAIELDASLPWLVAAVAGGPVLGLTFNALWMFGRQRRWLRPRLAAWDSAIARAIVRTGSLFLILQVSMAVAFESDSLVLARIRGAGSVSLFAVPFKLFTISAVLLAFFLTPLWPAYAESFARGDVAWARRTLRRSLIATAAFGVVTGAVLIAVGGPIVRVWAGAAVEPSFQLRVALALWGLLLCVGGAFAAFLNGLNAMRYQAVTASTMMTANLALSIVLTKAVGVPGVVWGSVISVTLFVFVPNTIYIARLRNRGHVPVPAPTIVPPMLPTDSYPQGTP
jgi:O-antigen/teichoic acid export membrane protein